jgi:hypothetical protein
VGKADRPLDEAIEEIVLEAPRRYTRLQVSEAAGLDLDEGRRLWRSLGFAEVADDAVLFTERDMKAVRLMTSLTEAGGLHPHDAAPLHRGARRDDRMLRLHHHRGDSPTGTAGSSRRSVTRCCSSPTRSPTVRR